MLLEHLKTPPQMINCSIIIVNYNTSALTFKAVQSVIDFCTKYNFEIIVVDNASNFEDAINLKKIISELNDPRITLIRSRINTGFGAGNMIGVQQAKGIYYAFLNSDAYLIEDSISILIDFLKNHSRVSIVGAKSINEEGKNYKAFDHRLSLRKELFGDKFLYFQNREKYPSRKKALSKPTRVGAVPGSFFVCRAMDFDQVGGFDTNLFLFYEEKDLSFRIEKKLKKEIYSLPGTSYVHLSGKSTTTSYDIKKELKISQFYSIKKNLGMGKYIVFFTFNFLKFLLKSPFSRKNRKHFMLLLKGITPAQSLKHQQVLMPFLKVT